MSSTASASASSTPPSAPPSAPSTSVSEDHLDVDPTIPGQQFVCLSFVSPEKILAQKESYFRKAFWVYLKERHDEIDYGLVNDFEGLYDTFIDEQQQALEAVFHEENQYQTSIRGLKVRGTYNTKHEADIRARVLQRLDRGHHVFVAPVGYWLPWDPSADAIEDQVYQEEQLNELMQNYKQNEMKRDTFYEEQKDERRKAALVENEQKKEANKKANEEANEEGNKERDEAATKKATESAQTLLESVEEADSHASLKDAFDSFKNA